MPNPLWTCDERLGGTRLGKVRFSAAGDNPAAASTNANQNVVRRIEAHMILNLSFGRKPNTARIISQHRITDACPAFEGLSLPD